MASNRKPSGIEDKGGYTTGWLARGSRESEESFLSPGVLQILDSLPFYVLLVDKNHRILLANKATREQLGLDPEEIHGEYCPRVIHGIKEGTYPGCPLEEAVEKQRPVEKVHFDEDSSRWLKVAMYPTGAWTADAEQIYFHMIQDITENKEMADALRECQDKYHALLDRMKKNSKK